LEEEKEADRLLTEIAEASINVDAASEEKEGTDGRRRSSRTNNSRSKTRTTRRTRGRSKATR